MDKVETEDKVLEAAREVFQMKGFAGARMDDIAKASGVNKALLHYYFRSKQKLFDKVFREALGRFLEKVIRVIEGDLPLDVKIYRVVDMYSNMLIHNKNLPMFIMGELSENPDRMIQMIKSKEGKAIQNLSRQLREEHEKGNIIDIPVHEFFLNLLSFTVFPFIARPLLKQIFEMNENEFDDMIMERRKKIPGMLIEMLRTR